LTFAALRALPARTTSLPPAPPHSTYAPPLRARNTVIPSRIEGIPIVSIGETPAAAASHACPPALDTPHPGDFARAQFDSLAPMTSASVFAGTPHTQGSLGAPHTPGSAPLFPVHAVEVPARAANQNRWLQVVAACAFFSVLITVGVLRATNRIGPTAGAAPIAAEAARPAAPAAPKPAAEPSAAAEDPATAQPAAEAEEQPAVEVEAAPSATAATTPARGARPGNRPARVAAAGAKPAGQDHDIQLDSLFYGHERDERSVTLQLDGQSVILREGDVAQDLQVERILPDGVIFRRGTRLFAVYGKK
jgi:hypothetical protein